MAIPVQNIAVFLQKFTVTAPTASAFSALYNSVGVFTTNLPNARQWQFTFNGNFTSLERFEIIYDFSQVDTFGYSIRFEGNLNGFITCDKQIYASDRYLKYIPQTEEDIKNKIVRLLFKPPCPGQELVNRSLYYVVNLNDTSCPSSCAPTSGQNTTTITGTEIDVSKIQSGISYSQYTSESTTICGHKENISGTTVVFLYFTKAETTDRSYWTFTNMQKDWVVQFTNLTKVPDQTFFISVQASGAATPITCSYIELTFEDCPIAFNWDGSTCFTTPSTPSGLYTDPSPVTEDTTCD